MFVWIFCLLSVASANAVFQSERMKSVLVTGANRGIGLEFVKQLLTLPTPPQHIIATTRNPANSAALNEIARNHTNVHVLQLDVKHYDKFPDFAKKVENLVGDNGLNLLINNAGIGSDSTKIDFLKSDQMVDVFMVNTVAPLMLSKALLPLLRKASKKNSDLPVGISRAAIINISSTLGSIERNTDGGFYPYRCSKSALNMGTKSLGIDLREDKILAVAIHPGWVKTDLGGKNALLEVHDSVKNIIDTMTKLKEENSGGFVQYDGAILPW